MKTTMKRNILAIVLFVATIGYANTDTKNFTANAKRVKLEFSSVKKGHSVQIIDEKGIVIYFEKIQITGDFSKTFDLTALENGTFTAELDKDFEIIVKPFTVKNGTVTFLSESEKTIFKPIIRVDDNKVFLSKYNFENDKLDIKIYFENNLIHTETLEGKNSLNRIYSLSKVEKGSYTVSVNANDRSYSKKFNL